MKLKPETLRIIGLILVVLILSLSVGIVFLARDSDYFLMNVIGVGGLYCFCWGAWSILRRGEPAPEDSTPFNVNRELTAMLFGVFFLLAACVLALGLYFSKKYM